MAGYTSSEAIDALDPAAAVAAAGKNTTTPTSAATAAIFMELRKPLELAWNVELVAPEAARYVEDVTRGVSEGTGGGRGDENASAGAGEAQQGDGQVEASQQAGEGGAGGGQSRRGERGCARPRDPAWARLVFSDRKR